ncbi:hypothetical protein CRG98_003533 [Punica granatum]|uniref:Uncharacterized protein n=1 Tax=Punica granatum TaxID=22663 RepID=A0A2I0L5R4_PUNGR|nr:hypothetical protein CRG98_003533 [Punica granatum]
MGLNWVGPVESEPSSTGWAEFNWMGQTSPTLAQKEQRPSPMQPSSAPSPLNPSSPLPLAPVRAAFCGGNDCATTYRDLCRLGLEGKLEGKLEEGRSRLPGETASQEIDSDSPATAIDDPCREACMQASRHGSTQHARSKLRLQ